MADSKTEVSITRAAQGEATFDPTTGDLVAPASTSVYSGACLLNFVGIQERETTRGGEREVESRFQVSIPLKAGPVKIGDQVQVTRNDADPQLVDTKMWVAQLPSGSAVSRRRMLCSSILVAP